MGLALGCLREAPGLGIRSIGFTGGEPMLVYRWVARVTKAAVELGLESDDLSTNGVWWSDRDDLNRRLRVLQDAGFAGGFHLSVDAFHAGAGGEKQAEFIRAAVTVFGTAGNLSCAESPDRPAMPVISRLAAHLRAQVVEDSAETGRVVASDVTIPYSLFPVADVGQSSGVGVGIAARWFGGFDCYGHDSVLIDPSGTARFCLGFAAYAAGALSLGDVAKDGLAGVIASAAANPLLQLLCAEGPVGLRRVIEEREPGAFPQPWGSPCSFCFHCLTDSGLAALLRESALPVAV